MKPAALPDLPPLRAALQPKADVDKAAAPDAWQREMEKAQSAMWLGHQPVGTGARAPAGRQAEADARAANWRPAPAAPAAVVVASTNHLQRAESAASKGMASRTADAAPVGAASVDDQLVAPVEPQIVSPLSPGASFLVNEEEPIAVTQRPSVPGQALLAAVAAVVGRAATMPVEVVACSEPPRFITLPVAVTAPRAAAPGTHEPVEATPTPPRLAPRDESDPDAVRVYCQLTSEGLMVWIGASAGSGFNAQAVASQLQQALARQSQRLACLVCNGRVVTADAGFSPFLSPYEEPTWPLEQ